jgi:hypothetical protein
MLYLTGCIPSKPALQADLLAAGIGALLTPFSQRHTPSTDWLWAADNGCFASRWDEQTWFRWLQSKSNPASALFATIPDVVADHQRTVKRWHQYADQVQQLGYKAAFVLQDGASLRTMPMQQMDALFIGGSTKYKLSEDAQRIVSVCKMENKWIHMGRVNSQRRMQLAFDWGCDSVDGTYLAFAPDSNTPRLIKMMHEATQPNLLHLI